MTTRNKACGNPGKWSPERFEARTQITICAGPTMDNQLLRFFWRCGNLTKVTLPDGITRIGNYAFADCAKSTLDDFPKSLATIGAYAFKDCKDLKDLTVPGSVTTIERGAFRGCEVKTAN